MKKRPELSRPFFKNLSVFITALIRQEAAGLGDPYENRTRVTAVTGRCLNRLTNGPLVAAIGFEPTTLRV